VSRTRTRRAELFDGLVALLLAEGFSALTLDELAARLRCSKRTLYALAGSKEQLVRAAVVHFFRGATERVEAAVADVSGAAAKVSAYLHAVATELAPASPEFLADVAGFTPAAEVYARNTRAAARRVTELVDAGVAAGEFRAVHAAFVGDVVSATTVRIQQRQLADTTGLADAEAYRHLADLLLHGLGAPLRGASGERPGAAGAQPPPGLLQTPAHAVGTVAVLDDVADAAEEPSGHRETDRKEQPHAQPTGEERPHEGGISAERAC
jgi:AcrR family transcriptional regulator